MLSREEGFLKNVRAVFHQFPKTRTGQTAGGDFTFQMKHVSRVHEGPILIVLAIAPIDRPRSRQPSNCGIIITNSRLCATRCNNRGHKSGHRIYVFAFTARCLFDLVRRNATTLSNRRGGSARHMNRSIVSPRHFARR